MKRAALMVFISILTMVFVSGCGKQVFDGSNTGNDKQFILDYSVLNCTKSHEMKLEEGTRINTSIDNESGRLDIFVTGDDGKEIYKGDNAESGEFVLEIPKSGIYKFSVTGKDARGSVSFKVVE